MSGKTLLPFATTALLISLVLVASSAAAAIQGPRLEDGSPIVRQVVGSVQPDDSSAVAADYELRVIDTGPWLLTKRRKRLAAGELSNQPPVGLVLDRRTFAKLLRRLEESPTREVNGKQQRSRARQQHDGQKPGDWQRQFGAPLDRDSSLLKYSTRFSADDDSSAPLAVRPVRDHISPRLGRST